MCGFGLPKLYSVYSNHHDDSSGATESRRQGRNHGNQQVHTAGVGVRRGGATFQPEDGGTHRTGSIARRCQLRQEVAEKGSFGGQICPEQTDRNSIPTGTGDGEDVPDHETVGGELGASRSINANRPEKRLLGGIKKTKTMWERWYEATKEEDKLQSNKDVTVQCLDFCEVTTSDMHAVLRHAPAHLRGGTLLQHLSVLVATCGISRKPTSLSTDLPCSQVPGLSRCIHIATGTS